MVSKTTPRNQSQDPAIGSGSLRFGRVVNDAGLYTVPAGRRAILTKVIMNVDSTGSDATDAISIKKGNNYAIISAFIIQGQNTEFNGRLILDAGDIVGRVGDSNGTNAGTDMSAIIQEI